MAQTTMGWYTAKERCRICGYEAIAVFPEGTDPDNMECGWCGHMSSEAVVYYGPGGKTFEVAG